MEELVLDYVAALDAVQAKQGERDRAQSEADSAQTDADTKRAEILALDVPSPVRFVVRDQIVTVSQDSVTVEQAKRLSHR